MKRSPLGSSRSPDSPPKPRKGEVSTSPLRYSSEPKRTCERSRGSNEGIGRALTSIETGAVTENSSILADFGGGWVASCARATSGSAASANPAAASSRTRRRERWSGSFLMVRRRTCAISGRCGACHRARIRATRWHRRENHMAETTPHPSRRGQDAAPLDEAPLAYDASSHRILGMQSPPGAACGRRRAVGLAEQFGEFLGDGAAEFFSVHDGDGAAIIARHIMTDADRDQFDRRTGLDLLDDVPQVPLEIIAG